MKTRSKLITAAIAVAALSFGLGAVSADLRQQLSNEFQTRDYRSQTLRDMFHGYDAEQVFDGMSDGHFLAKSLVESGNTNPNYWLGLSLAFQQDVFTIQQANSTGTIDYVQ